MAYSKDDSGTKRRGKKTLGVLGVSLSLAGAACAQSNPADASTVPATGNVRSIDLHEEELFDVTLGSFHFFDREEAKDVKAAKPEVVAWWADAEDVEVAGAAAAALAGVADAGAAAAGVAADAHVMSFV